MSPAPVLIFGRRGYLASVYAGYWARTFDVHVSEVDVRRKQDVIDEIGRVKPVLVLNAAGKTRSATINNIDGCEESPQAHADTLNVNVHGAINVRDACDYCSGVPLVHLGSGCIYDGYGDQALDETHPPNPVSWYGTTKAVGDAEVAKYVNALVLWLRMPFGDAMHSRNLFTKLEAFDHVIDAPNSITYLPTLLRVTRTLLEKRVTGVFNVVQPDVVSLYRIAKVRRPDVQPWTPDELNAHVMAKRTNCVLSTAKLAKYGIHPEPVSRILGVAAERIAWQAGSA